MQVTIDAVCAAGASEALRLVQIARLASVTGRWAYTVTLAVFPYRHGGAGGALPWRASSGWARQRSHRHLPVLSSDGCQWAPCWSMRACYGLWLSAVPQPLRSPTAHCG
jgi:hypothetical protein